jgi:3-keto-5-aminohexanoate cleavage enzyme
MTGKLIAITVAPNGGRSRSTNEFFVPESPEEIAQEAVDCREAGASCVHFHARDEDGANSTDARLYEKAIKLIRERSDILIQTTNGVGDRKDPATGDLLFPTDEQRFPLLHLNPEPDYYGAATASFDFYHPDGYYTTEATFVNSSRFIREYIKQVYDRRKGQIEWEVFGAHSLHRLHRILIEGGIDLRRFPLADVFDRRGAAVVSQCRARDFGRRRPAVPGNGFRHRQRFRRNSRRLRKQPQYAG